MFIIDKILIHKNFRFKIKNLIIIIYGKNNLASYLIDKNFK